MTPPSAPASAVVSTPPSAPPPATAPAFLTARQLAAALGVSRRTITTWDQRRVIPSLCVGRVRRYELEQVSAALRAYEQPATPSPASSSSSSHSDSSSPASGTATPAACVLNKDNEHGKDPAL